MLVFFDHGTPRSITRWLHGHTVVEALTRGWGRFNGELLEAAETPKPGLGCACYAGNRLKSYSVNTSWSVLKVEVSVPTDTNPNLLTSRVLSTARI